MTKITFFEFATSGVNVHVIVDHLKDENYEKKRKRKSNFHGSFPRNFLSVRCACKNKPKGKNISSFKISFSRK